MLMAQAKRKAALLMRDSAKEPTNAVVAGSYSNGPVFEDVAAEKKERASNINHGNANAEIAEAVKLLVREELRVNSQQPRKETDAVILAKKRRKLERNKEETAAFSNREEEKDKAVGSSARREEKKEEAAKFNDLKKGPAIRWIDR